MSNVTLTIDPSLEKQIAALNPDEVLALAKIYGDWSRQLRLKAAVLKMTTRRPSRAKSKGAK